MYISEKMYYYQKKDLKLMLTYGIAIGGNAIRYSCKVRRKCMKTMRKRVRQMTASLLSAAMIVSSVYVPGTVSAEEIMILDEEPGKGDTAGGGCLIRE